MKTKFKVGDRVTCISEVSGNKKIVNQKGTIVSIGSSKLPLGIEFDNPIHDFEGCNTHLKRYHGWYVDYSHIVLEKSEKIVIYRKGNEVIAKDVNTGKIGVAKCDPRDEFDFKVGAKLALDRLTNNVTFKMLCVVDCWKHKIGKVYEAINGIYNYGDGSTSYCYSSFNDYITRNPGYKGKMIELKDGDDVTEIMRRYDTIKKGDMVRVVNTGSTYTAYSTWKGLKGFESHYVLRKFPIYNKKYKVLNVEKYDDRNKNVALIQDADTTQVFIIDIDGLKKC
jgi:hypothetical protein